jgi:hypothetical protein
MLERQHIVRKLTRDADDALAFQRQCEPELMLGKRSPPDVQERPRQRLSASGRFQHGEQCDAQRASPGKQARF